MKSHWRKILSFLPIHLQKKYYDQFFIRQHQEWEGNGKQLPVSNFLKQEVLKEFQKKYEVKILVETGTYLGDTLFALSQDFERLYSIELSQH